MLRRPELPRGVELGEHGGVLAVERSVPCGCGSNRASVEALADRLRNERGSIATSDGGVEFVAEFVVEGNGDAHGHVADPTNDTAPNTITDPTRRVGSARETGANASKEDQIVRLWYEAGATGQHHDRARRRTGVTMTCGPASSVRHHALRGRRVRATSRLANETVCVSNNQPSCGQSRRESSASRHRSITALTAGEAARRR